MKPKSQTILIVDDDPSIRMLLRGTLENAGYQVEEATRAFAAVELSRDRAVHLVILDLGLLESSGYEFLEQKIANPALQKIPVIVLSGSRDPREPFKAICLGASDYVVKPVDTLCVLKKVWRLLRDSSLPRVTFEPGQGLPASIELRGWIRKINELGFLVEAPAKIAERAQVQLRSEPLDRLGCTNIVFQRSAASAQISNDGGYFNEIGIVGLDAAQATALRSLINGQESS